MSDDLSFLEPRSREYFDRIADEVLTIIGVVPTEYKKRRLMAVYYEAGIGHLWKPAPRQSSSASPLADLAKRLKVKSGLPKNDAVRPSSIKRMLAAVEEVFKDFDIVPEDKVHVSLVVALMMNRGVLKRADGRWGYESATDDATLRSILSRYSDSIFDNHEPGKWRNHVRTVDIAFDEDRFDDFPGYKVREGGLRLKDRGD